MFELTCYFWYSRGRLSNLISKISYQVTDFTIIPSFKEPVTKAYSRNTFSTTLVTSSVQVLSVTLYFVFTINKRKNHTSRNTNNNNVQLLCAAYEIGLLSPRAMCYCISLCLVPGKGSDATEALTVNESYTV